MDQRHSDFGNDQLTSNKEVRLSPDEVAGIEEARADVDARGAIPLDEVLAWLNSLNTDAPLPEPEPRELRHL